MPNCGSEDYGTVFLLVLGHRKVLNGRGDWFPPSFERISNFSCWYFFWTAKMSLQFDKFGKACLKQYFRHSGDPAFSIRGKGRSLYTSHPSITPKHFYVRLLWLCFHKAFTFGKSLFQKAHDNILREYTGFHSFSLKKIQKEKTTPIAPKMLFKRSIFFVFIFPFSIVTSLYIQSRIEC